MKIMKKTLLSLIIILMIIVFSFTGCKATGATTATEAATTATEEAAETTSGEVVKLTFWHHEAPAHRVAAFQKAIDLFEQEFPNIKVEQEVVMWGDAWTKTIAAIEVGDGPDFQFSCPELLLTSYLLKALLPVTDLVNELDQTHEFVEAPKQVFFYNNEYWGVPIMTQVMLLTYIPSLLEKYVGTTEPPKSWEEYLEYAEKMTDPENGVYGVGLGGAIDTMTSDVAYTFLTNTGARLFDEEGNVIFNNPKTIQALQMYKDLYKFTAPGADAWSYGEMELNLMTKTVAMSTYYPAVQRRFALELNSNDYTGTDQPYPADGRPGTVTYPNEIDIFKWTKDKPGHLEATYEFIRFLMQPEINALLTTMEPGAFYPLTKTAMESPEFWNDPIVSRFEEMNRTAVKALDYATMNGYEYGHWVNLGAGDIYGANILAEVVNRIVTGTNTVEDAVAWGQSEMEKYSVPAK